jgi:Skp family chaperone for outer membrane proteins
MAARFDALNRLWGKVRESNHDFRASTDIFPMLDTEKLSRTFELVEIGDAGGKENKPPKSARALDEIEQRIVARVEEEKKASYQVLEDQFQHFEDRLNNLDFEGQFGLIRQANYTSLSDFKAEVAMGQNQLHGLRRDLQEVEQELQHFKDKHGLRRAAKVSTAGWMFFKIAFLVFLLLLETGLNGSFLAEGSALGILGGVTQAFTLAALNIGCALLLSVFAVRFVLHRSFFLKVLGVLGLGVYACIALGINLALAHYREVSAIAFGDAGRQVMDRLWTAPLDLADLNSWVLFGLGLFFSILAFIDGCAMFDPYPGFGNVQKRVNKARAGYSTEVEALIENLKEIRDEHNEKVELIIRDLSQRRQESQAILQHRTRVAGLFKEHQNQLERSANTLLSVYREANRKARTEPEPKYFANPFKMERISPTLHSAEEWNDRELAERIKTAQDELSDQMKKIGEEFEEAVSRYRQLDALFPGA